MRVLSSPSICLTFSRCARALAWYSGVARSAVLAVGFVLVNFVVDILHGVIDPRIRFGGMEA